MKALLIVNPSSGGEQAQEYEQLAEEKLREAFQKSWSNIPKKKEMPHVLPLKR